MATKMYLTNVVSDIATAETDEKLSLVPGDGTVEQGAANTVTGPTTGVKVQKTGAVLVWYSNPLNAVTIANSVTANLWMSENNMSANVGAMLVVDWVSNTGAFKGNIATGEKGTEVPVTTRAVQNWTIAQTTSAVLTGDRLRAYVLGNDIGTMATGFTFDVGYNGSTGGADGDSWVSFVETITESAGGAPAEIPFLVMARSRC